MPPRIRLVTFDALHTLITPRLPIALQYAQTFEPYLGPLDAGLLSSSFKRGTALYFSTLCTAGALKIMRLLMIHSSERSPKVRTYLRLSLILLLLRIRQLSIITLQLSH